MIEHVTLSKERGSGVYDSENIIKENMDFKNLNDNLISRRWNERYESLPEGVKKKIDALGESTPKEYLLKKIKRVREYPEVGTVFEVLTPQDITISGIVINNHINSILGEDLLTVVFLCPDTFVANDEMEVDCLENILIPPQIISTELWKKGYARNIGKSNFIMKPDYSFYDALCNQFFTEFGKKDVKKNVIGIYGLTTVYGISKYIQRELIIRGDI